MHLSSDIGKRVLLITAWYHPFIHPRAHRWTALAEHWAAQGHEVHVVCGRMRGFPKDSELNGVHIHRTGFDSLKEVFYYYFSETNARSRPETGITSDGFFSKTLQFLYRALWKRIHFPDDTGIWYFPALRCAERIIRQHQIEAMVSVSFPFTGHLVGLALKKRHPHLPWVADTGDPFTIHDVPLYNEFLYGKINRRLEKQVLETADCVTVTTPALKSRYEQVFAKAAIRKIEVVPPLLHPLDPVDGSELPGTWQIQRVKDDIHIGYFGTFLPVIRTPFAFLNLLDHLQFTQPALYHRIHIHIFGEVFPDFLAPLRRHPVIRLYGLRSRAHARAAMPQMDALLHVGNRTDYQLPSKAVDYLASGLPVVHLTYTGSDPFIDFWGDLPGLICLHITDDRVGEEDADQLNWESFAATATGREEMKRMRQASARAYGVEAAGKTLMEQLTKKAANHSG